MVRRDINVRKKFEEKSGYENTGPMKLRQAPPTFSAVLFNAPLNRRRSK
jgi:hypothetical protein